MLDLAGGDESALTVLMERYDRLVRYTIFRSGREQAVRDPQWIDAVAGETWRGFVQSVRRGALPQSGALGAYLAGIARRQTISAIRQAKILLRLPMDDTEPGLAGGESAADPAEIVAELDALEALRECILTLSDNDRIILSQLSPIVRRQWVEAAGALGLSESTLRSRWARIVERLQQCMEGKSPPSRA